MPNISPLQDDPDVDAWSDQVAEELNEVQDNVEALQLLVAALTARVVALENP